jgi:glutathione S-transferase
LSLADIIALVAVTHINDHNVEITEESYPHIYKLYQKVSALEAVEAELTRFSQKK